MFTGIVEEMGTIQKIERGSQSAVLSIRCEKVLEGTQIGDSIAVNGVCLTVTSLRSDGYNADVMAETMNRSSLGFLQPGSRVNLERAMPADGRFGGHIVAGHVDGTGTIVKIEKDETAVWYRIEAAPEVLRYIVEKAPSQLMESVLPWRQFPIRIFRCQLFRTLRRIRCFLTGKPAMW